MFVKIISSQKNSYWYHFQIGKIFEVRNYTSLMYGNSNYDVLPYDGKCIAIEDAIPCNNLIQEEIDV